MKELKRACRSSGSGVMTLDGKEYPVGPGDAILTRTGSSHGLKQTGPDDLVIMINYLGLLPGEQQNRYLLLGLVEITAGFVFATLYR